MMMVMVMMTTLLKSSIKLGIGVRKTFCVASSMQKIFAIALIYFVAESFNAYNLMTTFVFYVPFEHGSITTQPYFDLKNFKQNIEITSRTEIIQF